MPDPVSAPDPPAPLVPFPGFFSVVGYTLFCFGVVLIICEIISYGVLAVLTGPSRLHRELPEHVYETVFGHCRGTPDGKYSSSSHPWINQMSSSPAYEGRPWADEYWAEERVRYNEYRWDYTPFALWNMPARHAQHVNQDATPLGAVRRTINPECPDAKATRRVRIWVFGGSAVWGIGSPDWGTIASFLSGTLNAASDRCYEVTNFGADGYVTNQEVILLMQNLKTGQRPDAAVFLDGVNEAWVGAVDPALPSSHYLFSHYRDLFEMRVSCRRRLLERSRAFQLVQYASSKRGRFESEGAAQDDWDAKARATLDNYARNMAMVGLWGKEYGFKTLFFWQPALPYGRKPRSAFEGTLMHYPILIDHESELQGRRVMAAVKAVFAEAQLRSTATGAFHYLGDIFDGHPETLYIDWAHLAPEGNEIIAKAVGDKIEGALPSPKEVRKAD